MSKRFFGLVAVFLSTLTLAEIMLITEDWPPYNFRQDGRLSGFSVEIVEAMLEEMNLELTIQLLPGARGETLLENNPNVISFSLFRSPERENAFQWIGPLANETIYFYKHANSTIKIQSIDDARRYQVGSLNKGFVFSELEKQGFTNLQTVSIQWSLPKMLISRRIDLMVNLPVLGHVHVLNTLGHSADEIENTGVVLAKLPLYLAASKEIDPSIIARWQQSLDAIKASGQYDEIYNRYLSM